MSFRSRKNYIATAEDIVLSCDPSRRLLILGGWPAPGASPAYATGVWLVLLL